MARVEGALRMKRVGKFMILAGLASLFIGAITLVLCSMMGQHDYIKIALVMMIYLGVFPMIAGGGLWVSGWIVEGFLNPQGFE